MLFRSEIEPANLTVGNGSPIKPPKDASRPAFYHDSVARDLYFWDPTIGVAGAWVNKSFENLSNTSLRICGVTGTVLKPTQNDAFMIIGPTGIGFLAGRAPDNSFYGGNCRGIKAVDWQLKGNDRYDVASGDYSFIGSGDSNRADATFTAIVGGNFNHASNTGAFIGGGSHNSALQAYSFVIGGQSNFAGNPLAFLVNGSHSFVVGGRRNLSNGYSCGVVGGQYNLASGSHSVVIAGYSQTAAGYRSEEHTSELQSH